ncbi:transporter [Thalassobacillus devorans]|uniref:Transporter n=1 Tax=Thalassobacillus devorans TaxID=279813 RepID=A0ABQ1PH83_9BACI|nr:EamA family transporter RarD [Thalassobacillus devorans]NIK29492.1 chloramphenicol-sensitive protein RarD [Thalassobacillus devorans]GGC97099.1 transporter [Thalassobacillus devorans]
MDNNKLGVIYTGGAYVLWGFLPIYWKLVQEVSPIAILGHRIVWSFVFMIGVILILRKWKVFQSEIKRTWKNKKSALGITFASIAISINWLTYIWAVNNDHVVEASLGYYINPLVSILLGMIFFKETFNRPQWLAFILAAAGVAYMTFNFGSVPWLALMLAFSFGIYGLLKKTVDLNAMFGLTIETLIMTPIAAIYLLSLPQENWANIEWLSVTSLLLFGAGVATAIPLLLFAAGAKRIPLSMVGFLQYIAPTIMLVIGVFLYKEPFTHVHLVSFLFIWSGLLIYTYARVKRLRRYDQAA